MPVLFYSILILAVVPLIRLTKNLVIVSSQIMSPATTIPDAMPNNASSSHRLLMESLSATMESLWNVASVDSMDLNESGRDIDPCNTSSCSNVSSNTSMVFTNLLEQYRQTRDVYLHRRMMRAFLDHLPTFDGNDFVTDAIIGEDENSLTTRVKSTTPPMIIITPSNEEIEQQRLEQQRVLGEIQNLVQEIRSATVKRDTQYAAFVARREELQRMVDDLRQSTHGEEDDDDVAMAEEDVDETVIAEQEQRWLALQEQCAAMRSEIQSVEAQSADLEAEIAKLNESGLSLRMEQEFKGKTIQELSNENANLEEELSRWREMESFYNSLVMILEELIGIRIISVDKSPVDSGTLVLTVEIAEKFRLAINLQVDKRRPNHLNVVSATFINPVIIQIGAGLTLTVPDPTELVSLADRMPNGDNLRFILRETSAQIRAAEVRGKELAVLQEVALTKIGTPLLTNMGCTEQEVVCSLNREQISVVLRLSPDCPLLAGSVTISQMVGLGGWDEALIQEIRDMVSKEEFHRPVDVIKAIQVEIARREETEGFKLPETPFLPMRRP